MEEEAGFKCSICPYQSAYYEILVDHTSRKHRFDNGFHVHCRFPGCGSSFRSFTSFRKHLERRQHVFAAADGPIAEEENDELEAEKMVSYAVAYLLWT